MNNDTLSRALDNLIAAYWTQRKREALTGAASHEICVELIQHAVKIAEMSSTMVKEADDIELAEKIADIGEDAVALIELTVKLIVYKKIHAKNLMVFVLSDEYLKY